MLSVVVIGKNEAAHLRLCGESLSRLKKKAPFPIQTIYVDSASTDGSAEAAEPYFDEIYVLKDDFHLCASAGRHLGTLKAKGGWVLYLDGDMELCDEFADFLASGRVGEPRRLGYTGKVVNVYPDGEATDRLRRNRAAGGVAAHFGGAVLLPRIPVMAAGNWDPSIFSDEEIELHTRLRGRGVSVLFVDTPMVRHHTERYSRLETMKMLLLPWTGRRAAFYGFGGRQFYGFGQVLAARVKKGGLFNLVWRYPYPFLYWTALAALPVFAAVHRPWAGISFYAAVAAFVVFEKGAGALVHYLTLAAQVPCGWSKYDPGFSPTVERHSAKAPS